MCGIAGLFNTRAPTPIDERLVRRMCDVIAHRGPDGEGFHIEPGLALGHRRLAIIDLSGGAQPMSTPDGDVTVVFNGEIYNFLDLRAELEALGARFVTRSDTEILLQGWRYWAEGLLSRLNGMFAFALWDAREQALVLARDRFGKKPLHYAMLVDGALAFGSEIKSLACVPGIDRTIDSQAVEDFFTYGYVPDPKSIYRAIRKLPAAHYMVAKRGSEPQIRAYWSALDHISAPREQSPEALVERLSQAVKTRLISDVPLGALLSGGVDSSAVVALMALNGGSAPVNTFSIAFGEREFDESAYATRVAERYGAEQHVQQMNPGDFSQISRLPDIYDEPFGDISALPTLAVCAHARRSVTVALTGDGGDEVFAGYRRYAFHYAEERIRAVVPAGLRRQVFGGLGAIYPHASWLPRPLRARTTLKELALDPGSAYARIVAALPEDVRGPLLTEEFRHSLGGYDSRDVVRTPFNADAPMDALQRAQYADLMTYLPGDILTKVDRASMANSLELRSPLLDKDLFAWGFGLPPGVKLSGRSGKHILKKSMEPYLPKDLLYRPKQGFTVPLSQWLRGPLADQVHELARSRDLRDSGVVDMKVLTQMVEAHSAQRRDFSKPIWLVWVFDAFLKRRALDAAA